ncbi:hypothetical protein AVEN_247943-1 [Araneus ventricosus]|uniref:Uncharacterized protein n=1 Tax=Araneus ventricosus TaxID=182803 RepID=A0A4Y2CI11_ARAVE|nr:hypothetical protein AVEN_247943-1 [Araneus ventricosus]
MESEMAIFPQPSLLSGSGVVSSSASEKSVPKEHIHYYGLQMIFKLVTDIAAKFQEDDIKFGRSIVNKERNHFSPVKIIQTPETA